MKKQILLILLLFISYGDVYGRTLARLNSVDAELFRAVRENDFKKVKSLVENGQEGTGKKPNLNAVPRGSQIDAIYHAATNNNIKILKYLISKGADIDNVCNLASLIQEDKIDMANTLISMGASIGKGIACLSYGWDIHYSRGVSLRSRTFDKQLEEVRFLIEKDNADLNYVHEDKTPLHWVAYRGSEAYHLAKLLINNGANYRAKNSYGLTPGQICISCNPAMNKLLEGNGSTCREVSY